MQIRGMADAMFTDSLASAVIEQVCNKAEDEILEDFKEYEHTWRFGLGYGDFPLTGQKQFLDILDAGRRIGVCVNSGMTLVPTKSVTCIIGLGHNLEVSNVKSCDLCNFREKCTFRKDGKLWQIKIYLTKILYCWMVQWEQCFSKKEWSLELYLKH